MKLMDILRYKLLRIEHYLRMNLGKDKYGYQVFALHVISTAAVKCDYLLKQHYNANNVWKVGSYFILIEQGQG